ncbi:response regulator [Cohnella faecalis]|uniref:Response regulator n=1 Tax=Cohnella faecalis TaxID=2315694 RepID=A0A398CB16_9BACL|nr:response regulator [Cohnella faecalis]RIE00336.1 response regulator [Cohnella faecalis]
MLKMIIVDDEPLIREGLKSMPWERWGCMVAGEAEDGEDGLALVEETRPHFIITTFGCLGWMGSYSPRRSRSVTRKLRF